MKYWGAIRIAELKNRTDAELDKGYRDCLRGARVGFAKMAGGVAAASVIAIAPLMPLLPLLLLGVSPILFCDGYAQRRKNIDGRKAHADEAYRRTLLSTMPQQLLPQTAATPSPKPVFNGEAAVVLATDITPMKTIKIKAARATL